MYFVSAAAAAALLLAVPVNAQDVSPLGGVWTLNRTLSELPHEIGFNVNWLVPSGGTGQSGGSSGGSGGGSGGGGRGRRGSGGGGGGNRGATGAFSGPRESYDDSRRVQFLTGEARNPAVRLMVVDTAAAVTITNELGQSRVLHPTGKEESVELQGVQIFVTTKRDADQLVVVYRAEQNREVRYTYSHSANPSQLVVEVQFLEHGAGDKARQVYEPGVAAETATPPAGAVPPGSPKPPAADTFDARPGAELKGLKGLGILVENLSAQAMSCGLSHDVLETALSKRLADGGFAVRRNSDEDTYLYVNVMTTTLPDGMCVSRYDAFLYTHATANLSYRDQPALVQVSLMHRGGIGSSAPAGHATAVTRGLEGYVDLVVTQIRDANRPSP
jgi:hypothetical protein